MILALLVIRGARNHHLRRRYGITAEHADRMFPSRTACAFGQLRDRPDLMLKAVLSPRRDSAARFVAPPSDRVGPVDTGRPEGEPWPDEGFWDDDGSGAA